MKKRLLLLTCGLLPVMTYSQIGINTSEPQQALHVSGIPTPYSTAENVGTSSVKIIEPTIRIDGLNAVNNPAHSQNVNTLKRIYTSKDGDLMLRKGNSNFEILNEKGTIPTANTGIPNGGPNHDIPTIVLKTVNFTIDKESIVNIAVAVEGKMENYTSSQFTLGGDMEYHFGINLVFTQAPESMEDILEKQFAETTFKIFTTQAVIQRTETILNTNKNLLLQPGTYQLAIQGFYSGRNFKKTVFGVNNEHEYIKIVAIPTNRK